MGVIVSLGSYMEALGNEKKQKDNYQGGISGSSWFNLPY